jgi:subtilisin family serine protease
MRKIPILCWLFILLLAFPLRAQKKSFWVMVAFSDKGKLAIDWEKSSGKLTLSPEAHARRARLGIQTDSLDAAVHPAYLEQLEEMGYRTYFPSRWLNAALIAIPTRKVPALDTLDFVRETLFMGKKRSIRFRYPARANQKKLRLGAKKKNRLQPHLEFLNGTPLHEKGYLGEGIHIAVLDAGFTGADREDLFSNLATGTHRTYLDSRSASVFGGSHHGTAVLGLMAADLDSIYRGTAPEAQYTCLVTESEWGENRIEEYLWVAGLEYADSLGVDLVNSSLGYKRFPKKQGYYTSKDLDGKTAICSRGAAIAVSKGIFLVISTGNNGQNMWSSILFPADAKGILSVGSTDLKGEPSSFSSYGPTSDGRVKPEVVAPGEDIPVLQLSLRKLKSGWGTSYATPLISGLVACLMQAFPERTPAEIREALIRTASRSEDPDSKLGYGIPDFEAAFEFLDEKTRWPGD